MMSKDRYSKGKSEYSVTGLLSPPKVQRLREQYDDALEQDISEMLYAFLGTALHSRFEEIQTKNFIKEERLFTELEGTTVSGAIDIQEVTPAGIILWDYKFTSVWSVMKEKREWVEQLNLYKWLVETVKRERVVGLKVCAMLRDYTKYETKENYPQSPITVVDIPVWDSYTAETFVRDRLRMHQKAKVARDFSEELQDCTDEERWMSETVFAVKREGRKTAIKLFKSIEEANELAEKEKGYVETRKGEPKRCTGNYCGVNQWCSQYQKESNESN
jgi:hypothetical protein